MKKSIFFAPALLITLLSGCAVTKVPSISNSNKDEGKVQTSYTYGLFEKPDVKWDKSLSSVNFQCKSWGYQDAKQTAGPENNCTRKDQNGNCLSWEVSALYECKLSPEQQAVLNDKKQKALQAQQEENARAEENKQVFFNNLSSFKAVFACTEQYPGSGQAKQFADQLLNILISGDSQAYGSYLNAYKCRPLSDQIAREQVLKRGTLVSNTNEAAYYTISFTLIEDGYEATWGVVAK